MRLLGNIVFFVFGGFVIFLGYVLGGIVLCLTIIGIPMGFQCFKLAGGVLAPFGREVRSIRQPDSTLSVILNIIWIILPGIELAIMHLALAVLFGITIIGRSGARWWTWRLVTPTRDQSLGVRLHRCKHHYLLVA